MSSDGELGMRVASWLQVTAKTAHELSVLRNVANLVPPYAPDGAYHGVSAALEYAVEVLRVKHIVVLGHARCGGIKAYANNAPSGDFIGKWISLLAPAAA